MSDPCLNSTRCLQRLCGGTEAHTQRAEEVVESKKRRGRRKQKEGEEC